MKWALESTDLFREIHIFVTAHTTFDAFAFMGHTTLSITHNMM